MPWKETTAMKEKIEFICEWNSGNFTITELCNAFSISRPTAYKLIDRFEKHGVKGFLEQSRAPINHPNRTKQEVEDKILKLKEQHDKWGAKKLRILLFKDFSEIEIPSVVTVHNILQKHGLVCPQKKVRRVKPIHPIFDPKECNEVWSADYKGKFLMGNKKYCHALTTADSYSRKLLGAKGHYGETLKEAKAEFTRVFRMFGIPQQMHTDNGSPFGSVQSIQRFTQLSYWFIDLGIMPVFSDPASPQQNGRHERMHRDLKASCASPSCYDMRAQQRKLNAFVREYNQVRPHEALGMKTPSQVHQMSSRPFPERIPDPEYPARMKVMRVCKSGAIRWKSFYWVYVSTSLHSHHVGVEEIGNGIWKVYYRNVFLGYFNEKELKERQQVLKLYADKKV